MMNNKINNDNEHNIIVSTPEVLWHGGGNENGKPDPVYSVDYHTLDGNVLCTTGIDASVPPKGSVRLWKIDPINEGQEFLLDLCDHQTAVNVARFSPDGKMLASASNRQIVIYVVKEAAMWNMIADIAPLDRIWLRPSLSEDIFDLQWSPDSTHIIIGAIDSKAEIIRIGTRDSILLPGHTSYVQGVTWDPRNEMVVTQSADRSCKVHMIKSKPNTTIKIANRGHIVMKMHGGYNTDNTNDVNKVLTAADFGMIDTQLTTHNTITTTATSSERGVTSGEVTSSHETAIPNVVTGNHNNVGINLFADSFVPSFFRRLCYSPDGALVICPTGIHRPPSKNNSNKSTNNSKSNSTTSSTSATQSYCTHVFSREYLNSPCVSYIGLEEPSVVVRCFNRPYKLFIPKNSSHEIISDGVNKSQTVPIINGLYRFVFAVATISSILIYDTQHACPIAKFTGLHYAPINDLTWSEDGRVLVACSSDGYLSFFRFKKNCFGELLDDSEVPEIIKKGQPCLYNYIPPVTAIATTTEILPNIVEETDVAIVIGVNDEPIVDTNEIVVSLNNNEVVKDDKIEEIGIVSVPIKQEQKHVVEEERNLHPIEQTDIIVTTTDIIIEEEQLMNTEEKKKRKRIQPTLISSIIPQITTTTATTNNNNNDNNCSSNNNNNTSSSVIPYVSIENSTTSTTTATSTSLSSSSNIVIEPTIINNPQTIEEININDKENLKNSNISIANENHVLENNKETMDNQLNKTSNINNDDDNEDQLTDSQKKKKRITPILIATYTGSSSSCAVVPPIITTTTIIPNMNSNHSI